MRPVFRPWQLAVAVVAICGIAIAIAMYLRRPVDVPPQRQVAFMPHPDSTFVYVDLRQMRDSGLLDRLAGSTVTEEQDYRNFVTRTGFDYKTDLDSVLSAQYGDTMYFLVRGHFDWKALIAYTTSQGGSCRNGFCRIPGSRPNHLISFKALNPRMMALAMSSDGWAAEQIKPPANGSRPLDVTVPNAPLWAIIPGTVLQDHENVPTGTKLFAEALENTDKVVLTAQPEQDRFAVDLDAICKTEADAVALRAQLEGITQLLQKLITRENQHPNASDLSGILVKGSFTRVDRHVMGKWPVPREFVDTLANGS